MKATRMWALAAVAAGSLAIGAVQAAPHGGGGGGGGHGGWSGGHGGWSGGHGGWSGSSHGSYYHGGGSYHGGGYWHGGHWHGGGYYPSHAVVGFYFGAPWVWGPWYWWGYPYDYSYSPYYAPSDPAAAYPEGTIEVPPTTQVDPNAPGAPAQAPAYMNYCVSAKAYYPKVTTCPEGWKFVPSQPQ